MTWNTSSHSRGHLALMPNHPEINTKTSTQMKVNDSATVLITHSKVLASNCPEDGGPNVLKFTCSNITISIDMMRSSSILESRTLRLPECASGEALLSVLIALCFSI